MYHAGRGARLCKMVIALKANNNKYCANDEGKNYRHARSGGTVGAGEKHSELFLTTATNGSDRFSP